MNQFFKQFITVIGNFADFVKAYIASKTEELENLYSRKVQDQTKVN